MRAHLYPDRMRCRACRRFLAILVIDGQWCSYACAGKPEPSSNPADWPRGHFRWKYNRNLRVAKTAYLSKREASLHNGRYVVYLCDYCGMWHRASVRPAA